MKRYTAGDIAVATRKGNIDVDTQYVRLDHLIAAGCLVPVPMSEGMTLKDAECMDIEKHTNTFSVKGVDWRVYAAERRVDNDGHRYMMPITDNWPPVAIPLSTIVQPVRLVPLNEVEGCEPHDKYAGTPPHDVRGWEPN